MKGYLLTLAGLLAACGSDPNGQPTDHDARQGLAEAICHRSVECQSSITYDECVPVVVGQLADYTPPQKTNAEWQECDGAIELLTCSNLALHQATELCQ